MATFHTAPLLQSSKRPRNVPRPQGDNSPRLQRVARQFGQGGGVRDNLKTSGRKTSDCVPTSNAPHLQLPPPAQNEEGYLYVPTSSPPKLLRSATRGRGKLKETCLWSTTFSAEVVERRVKGKGEVLCRLLSALTGNLIRWCTRRSVVDRTFITMRKTSITRRSH